MLTMKTMRFPKAVVRRNAAWSTDFIDVGACQERKMEYKEFGFAIKLTTEAGSTEIYFAFSFQSNGIYEDSDGIEFACI